MKLLFAGDVVLNDKYKQLDTSSLFNHSDYDFCICNFEAPVKSNDDFPLKKIGPSLFQPKSSLDKVVKSGFNVVALANNHMLDFGFSAALKTKSLRQPNHTDHDHRMK